MVCSQDVDIICDFCASMEYFKRLDLTEPQLRKLASEMQTASFAAPACPVRGSGRWDPLLARMRP